ncbi:VOC family protein [Azohydromonas lata]|uniref:VOC family protein n=1 Tax=Azohydromonas lata TaxID=45677 RepID=UPI000A64825A|nr:VOC family protein [Azohydromonas lata]
MTQNTAATAHTADATAALAGQALKSDPNFLLLYVRSAVESAGFYAALLGKAPVESSPTFALFALDSGVMLGLWGAGGVVPAATAPGGMELAFAVPDKAAVEARHADWTARGIPVIQPPTAMDFGFTFAAQDPDGHRLRVFAPGAQ